MGVGLVVDLAPAAVGDVRVQLGGGEVGMAEHLLDAAQVGAALQKVGREGVAEEMRGDALRLQPGLGREAAEDEEGARSGQRATLRVEKELGTVAAVEVGAAAREVAAESLHGLAADGDDPLLVALPDAADEASVEVDAALV